MVGQSYAVQIRSVMTHHYRYLGQSPFRASLDRQVKQLTVHYKDLRGLGFDIQDVTTFGLRHAKALLAKWQSNKCAPTTIYPRWSVLRTWSRALGKHGMLGTLTDLLPGFDRRPEPGSSYRVLTIDQLSARSAYLESKPDLTAYFVDRLCRDLALTRESALQVELHDVKAAVEAGATVLRIGMGNARQNIPVSQVHLPLLIQLRDFLAAATARRLPGATWTLTRRYRNTPCAFPMLLEPYFLKQKAAQSPSLKKLVQHEKTQLQRSQQPHG